MSHASLNAVVVGKTVFRNGLFALRVAHTAGDPAPVFVAGQYAVLGLPLPGGAPDPASQGERRRPPRAGGMVRRSYSVASPPSERRFAEFYVVRVDAGQVSPKLAHLNEGDALYMAERFQGRMTLDNAVCEGGGAPDVVMLATGTGLAPFLAMLREARHEKLTGKPARWRRCALLHGVREEADLGYRAELEEMARHDPSFVYLPSLTRAGGAWGGRRGRVQTAFADGTLAGAGIAAEAARTHVFLYGAPGMIDETEAQLVPQGFKPWKLKEGGNLHLERFW